MMLINTSQAFNFDSKPVVHLIGSSSARIWGITSRTRITRQLHAAGIEHIINGAPTAAAEFPTIIIHIGYVYAAKHLANLLQQHDTMLVAEESNAIVALHLRPGASISHHLAWLGYPPSSGCTFKRLTDLTPEAFNHHLRRQTNSNIQSIENVDIVTIERKLYGDAYKGITDLVTKWIWPWPARQIVKWCAHADLHPTAVTTAGFILIAIATWCFGLGHYGAGLSCGWIASLLDTVDGKLARVAIRSSRLGHVLDHGIDAVHPPFWYLCWGLGLSTLAAPFQLSTLNVWCSVIVIGYAGGRLVEKLFKLYAAKYCVFSWRPFDAYFRMVTARRNPCLLILSVTWLLGRPDLGFVGVATWTCMSTIILLVRLLQGVRVRTRDGPLKSWLQEPIDPQHADSLAYATFSKTAQAYR